MWMIIAAKSYRAKGKRISTLNVKKVEFTEPLQKEASAFSTIAGNNNAQLEEEYDGGAAEAVGK